MDFLLAYRKMSKLPEHLQKEVLDFIEFLLNKKEKTDQHKKPRFGSAKGLFTIKPDFDEPLDDFKDYVK